MDMRDESISRKEFNLAVMAGSKRMNQLVHNATG